MTLENIEIIFNTTNMNKKEIMTFIPNHYTNNQKEQIIILLMDLADIYINITEET